MKIDMYVDERCTLIEPQHNLSFFFEKLRLTTVFQVRATKNKWYIVRSNIRESMYINIAYFTHKLTGKAQH